MEQAIITQFGKPVGGSITTAGIHFKIPIIQKVIVFEKRILSWDGDVTEIPTKGNKFIRVDTYAKWRISEPLKFYMSVRDEMRAQSRLDDLLDGSIRDEISKRLLVEIIRDSDRLSKYFGGVSGERTLVDTTIVSREEFQISGARRKIIKSILERVNRTMKEIDLGIEVVDIQLKRIDYNLKVQEKVFNRMISEQLQIAEKFRAQGQGEKQRILGEQQMKLNEILSSAYQESQEIRGRADSSATKIYADAYNKDPEFYSFWQTLQTYSSVMDSTTEVILSTDIEFLRYLESTRVR
jgi:membrane protease subunit HflC